MHVRADERSEESSEEDVEDRGVDSDVEDFQACEGWCRCCQKCGCSCKRCSICCGKCLLVYICVIIFFSLVYWLFGKTWTCAIWTYEPQDVLRSPYPISLGLPQDPMLTEAGFDFTGVWWLRWRPPPPPQYGQPGAALYDEMRFEELGTFANATTNSSTFPMVFVWRAMMPHHWSYSNFLGGKLQAVAHAFWGPSGSFTVTMVNRTNGYLNTKFLFIASDDPNEWYRPTVFSPDFVVTYTLTRVVYGNGTATEWFPKWVEHMSIWKLVTWGNDSKVQRIIAAFLKLLLWPDGATCGVTGLFR